MRSSTCLPPSTYSLLLVFSLVCGCTSGGSDIPLHVDIAGCAMLRRGPLCEFEANKPLNLWIETAIGAELRISAGGVAQRVHVPQSSGQLKAQIVPGPDATLLTVQTTIGGRRSVVRYALAPHHDPPWLTRTETLKRERNFDQAEREVAAILTPSLSTEEQAQAHGLLARIALNRGHLGEASVLFRKALALDRASGLISAEANHALGLVFTLMRDGGSFAEIQRVVTERESVISQYPEWRARVPYYLGQVAYVHFDPQRAYQWISEARQWAYRLDMTEISDNAPSLLAQAVQELGDHRKAAALLREQLAKLKMNPGPSTSCEQAFLIDSFTWSYLQALDTRRTDPLARSEPLEYPPFSSLLSGANTLQDLLQAVLAAYPGCGQSSELARIYLNLARAELVTGTPQKGPAWIALAAQLVPKPKPAWQLERLELTGQLALAQQRSAVALGAYLDMAKLAELVLMPQRRWQALIGQAEAYEQLGDLDSALAAARRAEALLDTPQLGVVLCQDHLDRSRADVAASQFLSECVGSNTAMMPFQRGTRLYLELMLRLGHKEQALDVLRMAQTRTLAAWQLAHRIRKLDDPGRQRWQDAIEKYQNSRLKVSQLAEKSWVYSEENQPVVRAELDAAEQGATADFNAVLDALPAAGGPVSELAAVPANAALYTCHPLIKQWVCLAKYKGRIEVQFVPAALFEEVRRCIPPPCPAGQPSSQCAQRACKPDLNRLARGLLQQPVRALIAEAAQLWVIPVAELRFVDFSALPFPDPAGAKLLIDAMPISYMEDLPSVAAAKHAPSEHALVVLDAHDELASSGLAATGKDAYKELASQGPARLLAGAPLTGTAPGVDSAAAEPATGQNLLRCMQQSDFLLYIGHNQVSPEPFGWDTQLLTFDTPVRISDLLALAHGPRTAILIGCETGGAATAQSSDQLSMAQVLLMQGGRQILSAVRIITPAHANLMLRALIAHGALAPKADLGAVLQAAQVDVRAYAAEVDWSAYRVYVH